MNKLRSSEVQIPFYHTRFWFFFCDLFFSSSTVCVAVVTPPSGLVENYKQEPDKSERWLVKHIYSAHFYINLTNSKNKILSLNYEHCLTNERFDVFHHWPLKQIFNRKTNTYLITFIFSLLLLKEICKMFEFPRLISVKCKAGTMEAQSKLWFMNYLMFGLVSQLEAAC